MSRFQLACKQHSSIWVCVCVSVPEITNFNTDETEMNGEPGAIAHLQICALNKTQTGSGEPSDSLSVSPSETGPRFTFTWSSCAQQQQQQGNITMFSNRIRLKISQLLVPKGPGYLQKICRAVLTTAILGKQVHNSLNFLIIDGFDGDYLSKS